MIPTAQKLLDNAVGRTQEGTLGIAGFNALVRVKERAQLTANITTNYVEDGSPINDHIINEPFRCIIEGNVGDVHLEPSPIIEGWRRLQAEVGNVTQFLPERTQAQISRVSGLANDLADGVHKLDAVIDAGNRALTYLGIFTPDMPNQAQFINAIEMAFHAKHLFSLTMPHREYPNMAIRSVTWERDNTSKALNFQLEAQEIRLADSIFAMVRKAASGLGGQVEKVVDKAPQAGKPVPRSTLHFLFGD